MELISVVRVSTSGQDTEGQKPANAKWARLNGHVITDTIEVKASAYKFSGMFEARLGEILATKPQGIVMRRLDRLSRQGIEHGLSLITRINAAGVKLYMADMGDSAEINKLVAAAIFHVAHEESRVKAERTLDNHGVIASRGAWTGVPPFGYQVAGSGELNAALVVSETEAGILRELFTRCRDGASLSELAAWACSLGYVRPTPKGQKAERPWQPKNAQLRKLLDHEAYATGRSALTSTPRNDDGKPDESRRITWEHEHEPVITRELFDAARAAKGSRRNRADYSRDDTLQGLEGALRCARCDGKLYLATQVKNGKSYTRYQCRKGHGMPRAKAELVVAEMMHGHYPVKSVETTSLARDTRAGELDSLRKELARMNAATDEGFARIVELRQRIAELGTAEPARDERQITWLDVSVYQTSDWPERRDLVRKAGIRI